MYTWPPLFPKKITNGHKTDKKFANLTHHLGDGPQRKQTKNANFSKTNLKSLTPIAKQITNPKKINILTCLWTSYTCVYFFSFYCNYVTSIFSQE